MIDRHGKFKVGILGGGQLARMLIQQGQKLGLEMHVMCPKVDEPAAQVTCHWFQGNPRHEEDIIRFMSSVDFVTFESEFIDGQQISRLNKKARCQVNPSPLLMDQLQDRWSQKNWLMQYRIPTAPFMLIENSADLLAAAEKFPQGFVLKKRRYGYDGYGTFIISPRQSLLPYQDILKKTPEGFIAEAKISFKRELAIQLGRSQSGDIAVYPLVESFQQDQRCLWVKGPIHHRSITALTGKIKKLLKSEKYVGMIAFELFDTSQGLMVNEIAPRVHNSAHYSLDALSVDQFSMHLKCLIGEKIKSPLLRQNGFAMLNLLGKSSAEPKWSIPSQLNFHWYGKTENRPGRKMGHLTALAKNPSAALNQVLESKKEFSL